MPKWKNRIVGEAEIDPAELVPNPLNWRTHPDAQRSGIAAVLGDVGWVGRILINKTTGHMLDGHARKLEAIKNGEKTVPVTYVELTLEEERIVLGTFDPLGAMAQPDHGILRDLAALAEPDSPEVEAIFAGLLAAAGDSLEVHRGYTRKIEIPIYEPHGDKPPLAELSDNAKTKELIAEIDAADLPADIKGFLYKAAGRHTVFDYSKIAEYYAQSSSKIQALMESSALVIIDIDQAVEKGFVKLTKRLAEQYTKETTEGKENAD